MSGCLNYWKRYQRKSRGAVLFVATVAFSIVAATPTSGELETKAVRLGLPTQSKVGMKFHSTVVSVAVQGQDQMFSRLERQIYLTWLVSDTERFFERPAPTSQRDRQSEYGLTYAEWNAIFVHGLCVADSDSKTDSTATNVVEFSDLGEYPLLSRMGSILEDAIYEQDEIADLRRECIKARGVLTNPTAVKGLEKLLQICDEAASERLSVYFLAD